MQSWAERQALAELNNPMSPYFVGGPSIPQHIQNILNSNKGYNTNYFGSAARGFLAQPNADNFQRRNMISESRKFKDTLSAIGTCVTATLGILLLRKIPGSKKVFSLAGKALLMPFKTLKYVGKGLAWLCKGSKT